MSHLVVLDDTINYCNYNCCRVAVCVLCIFLVMSWFGQRSVIVAFPGHTRLFGVFYVCSLFSDIILCIRSSLTIISLRKRDTAALL